MWHDTKKIVSEPRTVPRCLSLYYLDHSHNPSNTSCDLWPPGELGAGTLPYRRVCICVVETATGMDRTALEPDIASETAVLLSRPPQPLLEQPPKRTIFYVLLSRRKLSKCL